MLSFPSATKCDFEIGTDKILKNTTVSENQAKEFRKQINKISLINKLSQTTLNAFPGENVTEIEIFHICVKSPDFDSELLKIIDKAIPYHNIFILDSETQFCIVLSYLNKQYKTEWTQDISLTLNGLNLDAIYENFVRQVAGNYIVFDTGNLSDDVEKSIQLKKNQKEIDRLEKLARAEKQPKKKFEIVQKINQLKNKYR